MKKKIETALKKRDLRGYTPQNPFIDWQKSKNTEGVLKAIKPNSIAQLDV